MQAARRDDDDDEESEQINPFASRKRDEYVTLTMYRLEQNLSQYLQKVL